MTTEAVTGDQRNFIDFLYESQVVMVYTLIDSTSETGAGTALCAVNIFSCVFFFEFLSCENSAHGSGWSDAFNFYKWFFVIYTSLQWIALVAWSLAVEKQAEARMKQ